MRKNKILAYLAAVTLVLNLLTPISVVASFDQTKAVVYLKSGSIDEWAVMALASAGALSGASTSFLAGDPGSSATSIEKRILALAASGGSMGDLPSRLAAAFNGTEINTQANLLNDDIFGLLAFVASGSNPSIQSALASFIKQNQNSDGGWSFVRAPSQSDSNMTAMAIMALIASGESPSSSAITRGYGYLATTLTGTGFAYDTNSGFGPDSASTSWAISAYIAGGRSVPALARAYLESLQRPDGAFSWQTGGSADRVMTAYAVVALSGKFYPVRGGATVTPPPSPPPAPAFDVRITGPQGNIFQGTVVSTPATALGALDEAAKAGGFLYVVRDTSLGLFVESIAGIGPSGSKGWMYAVNGVKPSVGAALYILQNEDRVIWFYGEANNSPPTGGSASVNLSVNVSVPLESEPAVSLTASRTSIRLGDAVQLFWSSQNATSVASSSPGSWAGAVLSGTLTVQPAQTTTYSITVSGPGGTKQAAVAVNVDQTPQVVFGVSTNNLNLGNLSTTNTAVQNTLTLTNSGRSNLMVTATLQNADGLYQQALFLNGFLWSSFREDLDANFSKNVNVSVTLPTGYRSNGTKTGTLIFWANPR